MKCPCCGNDVSSVDREIKLELPEAVLGVPADQRRQRVEALGTAFMRLDQSRYFVRALLPVRLSDGHEFHFGVWLEVESEVCRQLWSEWESPRYAAMRFAATLANSVPPWNDSILGAACTVAVRDQDELPYVERSTDPRLGAVLTTPWPREECEQLLDRVWA